MWSGSAGPNQSSVGNERRWLAVPAELHCKHSSTQCAILAEAQPRQIVRIKEALDSLFTNNIEMENDKTSTGLYRSCAAL